MSQEQTAPSNDWKLRAIDGTEYGPVSFDGLRTWAAQNRFTAGYTVSNNSRDWRPVETIPGLGMDWFVELDDGSRYGPFHPLALMDYLREGSIPPDARVAHKSNGGAAKAFQVLLEAFVDAIDQTTETQALLTADLASLREKVAERDRWFGEVSRKLQEEAQKRQELELAARRPPDEQAARVEALQIRVAELERSLALARQEQDEERQAHRLSRVQAEEQARREREEADARVRKFESYLRDLATGAADEKKAAEAQIARLTADLAAAKELARAESETREEAREAREALAQARADLRQRQEEMERRLGEAETRAAEAAAAASRAEAELARREAEARREREEQQASEVRWRMRAESLEQELRQARERLHAARRESGAEPVSEAPPAPPPPPRQPGVLAGLEARAQAELKAWQEKSRSAPPLDGADSAKPKTWMPWKKS